MAAKGLVPLGPTDLITVLYQLSHDPDEQIRNAATQKASSLPENILQGALSGKVDNRVIDFYAKKLVDRDKLLEVIILNHATADETIARLAKSTNEMLSELVATNEQRMLRFPQIIENLYNNKYARMSTVNRAIELAVRNNIILDGIAAFKEVAEAIKEELIIEERGPTPADEAFASALKMGEELGKESSNEEVEEELADAVPQSEKKQMVHQQIANMSTTEKIRAAQLGEAVMRPYLIRDNNKLVAMAVIKSPRVQEMEATGYAKNKNLSEEVIRYIANNKNWTKTYTVKLALVENPKTPLPKVLGFLSHLRTNDLRSVSRSKGVPAAVAQAARNLLNKRMG